MKEIKLVIWKSVFLSVFRKLVLCNKHYLLEIIYIFVIPIFLLQMLWF